MEGMEFYLTTPPPNDKSYEEKRKYKKRKSYQYLGEDCLEQKGSHPNYVRSTRQKLTHDV
jgi:hypothetical protein